MKKLLKIIPVFLLTIVMVLTSCNPPAVGTSSDASADESGVVSQEATSSEDTSSKIDLTNVARLQNTYKLLTEEKKLTIGYLGGSITLGTSANRTIKDGKIVGSEGNFDGNYVNRVSAWFAETFPDAEIETVNAGISDTTTAFGLYRLANHLMNEDGHDMPDLVFIEFTSNDSNDKKHVTAHAESLIREILDINPYCEIVIISTTVNYTSVAAYPAYMDVAQHYKFLFADVGKALAEAKAARGAPGETTGKYYYTVDNLHPSSEGYKLYTDKIVYMLEYHVAEGTGEKINRKEVLPEPLSTLNLIEEPVIITAEEMTLTGNAQVIPLPLTSNMFLTKKTSTTAYPVCKSFVKAGKDSVITAKFNGNSLGMLIGLTSRNVSLRYRIDGGAWETFLIDENNRSGQRYEHNKLFMLTMELGDGEHTLTMEVKSQDPVQIGGFCVDAK